MKIEFEIWLEYLYEARKDADVLDQIHGLFLKVCREYPLSQCWTLLAVVKGYKQILMERKSGER